MASKTASSHLIVLIDRDRSFYSSYIARALNYFTKFSCTNEAMYVEVRLEESMHTKTIKQRSIILKTLKFTYCYLRGHRYVSRSMLKHVRFPRNFTTMLEVTS